MTPPTPRQVYWADFGHDETKAVGELRAMPRQFAGPWIQASRVSLAGLEGLTASSLAAHVFRELTDGKLLSCKFRGKDQPVRQRVVVGAGAWLVRYAEREGGSDVLKFHDGIEEPVMSLCGPCIFVVD